MFLFGYASTLDFHAMFGSIITWKFKVYLLVKCLKVYNLWIFILINLNKNYYITTDKRLLTKISFRLRRVTKERLELQTSKWLSEEIVKQDQQQ